MLSKGGNNEILAAYALEVKLKKVGKRAAALMEES